MTKIYAVAFGRRGRAGLAFLRKKGRLDVGTLGVSLNGSSEPDSGEPGGGDSEEELIVFY